MIKREFEAVFENCEEVASAPKYVISLAYKR